MSLQCSPNTAVVAAKSLQSCPTLCNPIDGSPPGSTGSGILQAGTLEWVAISFSKYRSSQGFHGEAHTSIPHKVAGDQMSTSSCACTVLQEISAVTYSFFAKRGVRESEHAIVANLLSPSECPIKYFIQFLIRVFILLLGLPWEPKTVKNLPALQETSVQSLGQKNLSFKNFSYTLVQLFVRFVLLICSCTWWLAFYFLKSVFQ